MRTVVIGVLLALAFPGQALAQFYGGGSAQSSEAEAAAQAGFEASQRQDYPEAVRQSQFACSNGSARGCNNLGSIYYSGEGVAQDYAQAATLYQSACSAGFSVACSNLGATYYNGEGVPQDDATAVAYYQRALELDPANEAAASNLAIAQAANAPSAAELAAAAEAARRASQQAAFAQAQAGYAAEQRGDFTEAVRQYQGACSNGNADGCNNLGSAYSNGHGVAQDLGQAVVLYQRALEFQPGHPLATSNLAIVQPARSPAPSPTVTPNPSSFTVQPSWLIGMRFVNENSPFSRDFFHQFADLANGSKVVYIVSDAEIGSISSMMMVVECSPISYTLYFPPDLDQRSDFIRLSALDFVSTYNEIFIYNKDHEENVGVDGAWFESARSACSNAYVDGNVILWGNP